MFFLAILPTEMALLIITLCACYLPLLELYYLYLNEMVKYCHPLSSAFRDTK